MCMPFISTRQLTRNASGRSPESILEARSAYGELYIITLFAYYVILMRIRVYTFDPFLAFHEGDFTGTARKQVFMHANIQVDYLKVDCYMYKYSTISRLKNVSHFGAKRVYGVCTNKAVT